MDNRFNSNDTAFLIESNRIIREVRIVKYAGGLYTIQFVDGGGGIKVRESRLFSTKEEADTAIQKPRLKTSPRHPTPWD